MEKQIQEVDRLISDLKFLTQLESELRSKPLELESHTNGKEIILSPSKQLLDKIRSEVSSLKMDYKVDLENRIKK